MRSGSRPARGAALLERRSAEPAGTAIGLRISAQDGWSVAHQLTFNRKIIGFASAQPHPARNRVAPSRRFSQRDQAVLPVQRSVDSDFQKKI
jgi:hypothetical protein